MAARDEVGSAIAVDYGSCGVEARGLESFEDGRVVFVPGDRAPSSCGMGWCRR